MTPSIEQLLKDIESARRSKRYVDMDTHVVGLEAILHGDNSPEAAKIRSQLNYERHMAAFQQAESHLHDAKHHAENAIREAQHAGDGASELFATMVLGGHTLPALRQGREAMRLLADACKDAETLFAATTDPVERGRFERVLMNIYWHRILLAIEYGGDKNDVQRWKATLESNPTFQQYRHTAGAKVIADAQAYIDA